MASVRLLRQQAKNANQTNERQARDYNQAYKSDYQPAFDAYKVKETAYNKSIAGSYPVGTFYVKGDGTLGRIGVNDTEAQAISAATKNTPGIMGQEDSTTTLQKQPDGTFVYVTNYAPVNAGFGMTTQKPPVTTKANIMGNGLAPGAVPVAPKDPVAADPKFTTADLRKLNAGGGESQAQQEMLINKGLNPNKGIDADPEKTSVFYDKDKAMEKQGILTRTLAGQFGKI